MKTRSIILLALASLASTLVACDTVKAPYRPVPDQIGANYPKITVSGELAGFIETGTPIVEKSDVLKVTVPTRLRSDPGYSSNIQYRFLFFNANGSPARGGEMSWRFMNLPPRDQRFLAGNSMDSDATDWRCEIRLAQ
ncbi:hypothetical protein LBMAG48_07940 [Phycisphaerae bacterium]|jgi:uncharacterized protein YcfL|nr:hypothetical protein LBMAG48_07940 [Phycisphaerae bacterium]